MENMKKKLHFTKAILLTMILLFGVSYASMAATYTATASGNWSSSTTWGGTGAPGFNISGADNIIISAASGGFFPGWTTIPITSRDNPVILTLEAVADDIKPRTAHLHIWVDQRCLHAKII